MPTPLKQILDAIEHERDNLARAQALLECLRAAMEYAGVDPKHPYYPDLVQMASSMVRTSIEALDPINLPAAHRDVVKEDFVANAERAMHAVLPELALLTRRKFLPRPGSLRLHRRNYSRSVRVASSSNSASAKMPG